VVRLLLDWLMAARWCRRTRHTPLAAKRLRVSARMA